MSHSKYILTVKRGQEDCLIVRAPGHPSRLFRPSMYGGMDGALAQAEDYLDRLLTGRKLPPPERPAREGNEVGVPGVKRKVKGGRAVWTAEWNDSPNHTVYRSFSVKRHGEEKAKAMAIEARTHKT